MDEAAWRGLPLHARYARWEWLVLSSNNLKSSEKLICLTLLSYFRNSGRAYPSQKTLAKKTGLSDRWVKKLIPSFGGKKWIEVEVTRKRGQGWRRHEYILMWPPGFDVNTDEWMESKLEETEVKQGKSGYAVS